MLEVGVLMSPMTLENHLRESIKSKQYSRGTCCSCVAQFRSQVYTLQKCTHMFTKRHVL